MTDDTPTDPSRDPGDARDPAPGILPVIMCGGSGTRLWPASRESMPKQFIPLLEDLSNFQVTARRFDHPGLLEAAGAGVQRRALHRGRAAPGGRRRGRDRAGADSARLGPRRSRWRPAWRSAARPAPSRWWSRADHLISDMDAFVASCMAAAAGAREGYVMTLGVAPTAPATGYGYIHPGSPIPGTGRLPGRALRREAGRRHRGPLHRGRLPVEQRQLPVPLGRDAGGAEGPRAGRARRRPRRRRGRKIRPRLPEARRRGLRQGAEDLHRLCRDGAHPPGRACCRSASPGRTSARGAPSGTPRPGTARATLSRARSRWWRRATASSTRTACSPPWWGSTGSWSWRRRTPWLVTSRERSDAVKDLVAQMKAGRRPEVEDHLLMYRPWGSFQRIDIGPRFQVKRITVKPGHRLSLQKQLPPRRALGRGARHRRGDDRRPGDAAARERGRPTSRSAPCTAWRTRARSTSR